MTTRPTLRRTAPLAVAALALGLLASCSADESDANTNSENKAATEPGYVQTNLVANWEAYHPQIVEPELENAWGISLRPAGAGGHFWITAQASGKSFEYVGDVGGKKLFQDELKEVTIPEVAADTGPTGTVFNEKGDGFVITQKLEDAPAGEDSITAPAKFLFATDSGIVTAWTERENEDGTKSFPATSEIVFNQSKQGSSFLGMAITPANDKILLADFGERPGLVVVDDKFQVVKSPGFQSPFSKEYQPFNVQTIGESIFVTYAAWGSPGEEEPAPGEGRLAEFSADGKLIAEWEGGKYLNAPWGVTQAPESGFGEYDGALLVSNFGDGTIAALDPETHQAIDFLRRPDGHRVEIDGLWDIKFGNGKSLGRDDALYFAAGPGPEADGIFGRLTWEK
ncbi:TIGR03118 family protein [Nocardioides speluncae]|uniref:TIGR03118 family protein n=1 Tax=Nocardioides speluncae TaxID=2670337 RepID=UPI000D699001|nr:TIGR03118 family protein [Nocardioides speluncae]